MANFSISILVGNLGKDPVLYNNDPSKKPVCFGSLGVSGKYPQRDANGQIMKDANTGKTVNVEYTTWYDFVIRGSRAVAFKNHHSKGKQVMLIGELRDKEYDTKLAMTPCYNADGTALLDANGQHFHAYTTHKAKGKELFVQNWVFMDNKAADGSAYAGAVAGAVANGMVAASAPANAPVAPPVVNTNPAAGNVAAAPTAAAVAPQNVQAAFTGAPTNAPAENVPAFTMPQTSIPQGV